MSRIGALKFIDPQKWRSEIARAMKEAGGRVGDAAKSLEISSRQLFRWLALDELRDIPRVENGLPINGRRGRYPKPESEKVVKGPKKTKRTSETKVKVRRKAS
jgi:transposase-like protein